MATVDTLSPTPSPDHHHGVLQTISPVIKMLPNSLSSSATVSAPETEAKKDANSECMSDVPPKEKDQELSQNKAKNQVRGKRRKRRHSFGEGTRGGKRRNGNRKNFKATVLPNKFLLGGNIADPLNLNSMSDEKVNQALNAVTPSSSPLPPRSSVVDVVVPNDIRDPLGLNTGSDVEPSSLLERPPNASKRKRKKRRRKSNAKNASIDSDKCLSNSDEQKEEPSNKVAATKSPTPDATKKHQNMKKKPAYMPLQPQSHRVNDPIVSPVIPQDIRRWHHGISPKVRRKQKSSNAARALTTEIGISTDKNRADSEKKEKSMVTQRKRRRTYSENFVTFMPRPSSEEVDVIIKSCFSKNLFKFESKTDKEDNQMNSKIEMNIKDKESEKETKAVKSLLNISINPESSSPMKNVPEIIPKQDTEKKDNTKTLKKVPVFKENGAKYQYGNYSQYYGYRNPTKFEDPRLDMFKKEWFKDKDVLDVGCNSGHFTLLIARDYNPRKIVGVDIDESLIHCARTNVRHYITGAKATKFPVSMALTLGPISAPPIETNVDQAHSFPYNVNFFHGNYVPALDDVLKFQEPEYDIIMCLSVSKWIHLNWGDEGLKRMFQRVYKQLRPGGKFILEPQPWKSYSKKKNLTERIYNNFHSIKLKPPSFPTYLRDEVGFKKVEYLDTPRNNSKGFERPIHVYYKPE